MNQAGFMVNVFVTDEEAREYRETMQQNKLLMASLDAEIAKAQAALKQLVNQRTEAQKLLESNSAPSDTEVEAIREIIRSKEQEMEQLEGEVAGARSALNAMLERREEVAQESGPSSSALDKFDADIDGARAVLRGLLTERDQTHETLEAHRALLSPSRRIPPEVLGEIFVHCLPQDAFIDASVTHCPLLLTQISSNWRSVALMTPALWTSLKVNLSTTSCLPNLPLIQAWITRSGSCPLSFSIEESIQKDYYEEGMITSAAVLELYAPHYHRWRTIRLQYQDWRINTGFLKLPCDVPPQSLQSLHLARDFWQPTEYDQLSLMLSAPRLRNCTWVSNTDLGTLHAPFPQLTTLFLERPLIAEDFMHILSESAKIELCQFFVLASAASNLAPPASPCVLRHNLRSLDLTADLFGPLFNQLELPSLTHISLRRFDIGPHPAPVWPHQEFMSLLMRSKCLLEQISLRDIDISPDQMIDCLRHTSLSLEKLILANDRRMQHIIINDDVLRMLTWTRPDRGLNVCPHLSMVKFWDCHSSSDGVLADMIESRWKTDGGPAKSLSIAFLMLESSKNSEDLQRLDLLNEERIGISILRR
ncbi:hypothetical protein DFH08DRAFT_730841 [Mycena albidolilacea]|uniref:F-box domain-containing protein n=1 Tax=Mycena albidolilacea TaxID=1033008 RepID=A0AAD7AP50_9AGAR|nr:hypothetical protein DFH08DRAFT_730841 [Mycena albidolilacea]